MICGVSHHPHFNDHTSGSSRLLYNTFEDDSINHNGIAEAVTMRNYKIPADRKQKVELKFDFSKSYLGSNNTC